MKRILVAWTLMASFSAAEAQLYSFPAPPMTVADCRAGYAWMRNPDNGLPFCGVPAPPPPPPPPCCAPPPPPACQYQANAFGIYVGDMGQCTADGGCESRGYTIWYGGRVVASEAWQTYMDWSELNARASAAVAAGGYRYGSYITGGISNGNNMGYGVYEVCR
ncbi:MULTISPECIES: hypothetical protein [unclassified Cupriavidus]|uniref:hypothetical protein n=1 Tax=unclassified Cupriavidus TaxID=2640874 RepID=UPI001AE75E42|nr:MULTISPECIES: hypothetical protein [unclassified Cupriavidus]MBP0633144.1 hypothetical protein [Cupriavidus sp. AcVe19-1a]MBP0639784.1 hypothetical protein [Cupriavidus sp. AcVe19-6a]